MSKSLDLRLLGNIEIYRDGRPATDLRVVKARALLSYLVVTGRTQPRLTLAVLLWGELPEAQALGNLTKALGALRHTLADHLIITRQTIAFNRARDYRLDVETFEARLADGSVDRLQEAVQLYRGDFLEGFYVHGAPEFENWLLAQRARLHDAMLKALHTLSTHFAGQGKAESAQAINYTTQLLRLEPWREEAHCLLMRLLALSGQRGAALAQYKTCCQVLNKELGVEPGLESAKAGAVVVTHEGMGSMAYS
jgi:DNA-binding SARP family transcriptional activator